MGIFSSRIAYFKNLANLNKLVLDGVDEVDADGNTTTRRSFIDVDNPEGELDSAIANLFNYPAVVQMGFRGSLVYNEGGLRRQLNHVLYFLQKAPPVGAGNDPAQRKAAYDTAERVMNDFTGFMWNDLETEGTCGPFENIDLSSFIFEMTPSIGDRAFGWKLSFTEQANADDILDFDDTDWNPNPPPPPPPPINNATEVIEFTNQALIIIDWTDDRKTKFSDYPMIQVWAYDADNVISVQNVPVTADAPYPATTFFTVDMSGPATGYIVLK